MPARPAARWSPPRWRRWTRIIQAPLSAGLSGTSMRRRPATATTCRSTIANTINLLSDGYPAPVPVLRLSRSRARATSHGRRRAAPASLWRAYDMRRRFRSSAWRCARCATAGTSIPVFREPVRQGRCEGGGRRMTDDVSRDRARSKSRVRGGVPLASTSTCCSPAPDWNFRARSAAASKRCREHRRQGELGLDTYPNADRGDHRPSRCWTPIPASGMPLFYKHWSFGKDFARNQTSLSTRAIRV